MNLLGSYNYAPRGTFGVHRHVCVVRRFGPGRPPRNGRGRLGLARFGCWGGAGCHGDGHLVHALHRDGWHSYLPIPVAYHWPTVLLSLFAAILASAVAPGAWVSRQKKWVGSARLAASVLMGGGYCKHAFTSDGRHAVYSPVCRYKSSLVVLSVCVRDSDFSRCAMDLPFTSVMRKLGSAGES